MVLLLHQLWPDTPLDPATLRSTIDRSRASACQVYLCAESDRQVLGFGSLTTRSTLWNPAPVGYVEEMVVDETHRGRGIGTRMLDRLIAWARDQGCSHVELDSAFHRMDAHAFYERRGFQRRAYLFSKSL